MSNLALISDQKQETLSIRATARLVGVSDSLLCKAFVGDVTSLKLYNSLVSHGHKPQNWRVLGVPIEGVIQVAHYYGFEAGRYSKTCAKDLWEFFQKHKTLDGYIARQQIKQMQTKPEKLISDKLACTLASENPRVEVRTPGGNIDLLTDKQVIEVKKVSCWKAAIGQVLVYSVYYPNHAKRIHLFGKVDSKMRTIIKSHCDLLNIELTFD